jgi:polygalacturonase
MGNRRTGPTVLHYDRNSMRTTFIAWLAGWALAFPAGAAVFDVRAYGAKGDGRALDTAAIQRAIDAAGAAGGGRVEFPAGTYLSGSIHLASHLTLYFDSGATLVATGQASAYEPAEPNQWSRFQDFGHSHFHNSLIWGEGLEDVSILGPGVIWGKGLTREANPGVGNKAIALKLCRNVIVRDISILMAGHFGILATGVDNLTIDNVKIDTNRDGIDIVRIANASVNSPWDDAIVLKATYALGFFRDTENVTIANCEVSGYDRGTFLSGRYERNDPDAPDHGGVTGRIKLGTESSGGFKNIAISNCVFERSRGLALESEDGGVLEDVVATNLTMRDIVSSPIFIRLGSRMRSPEGTPVGQLRRVTISNVTVSGADARYAAIVSGIPGHPVEDVRLSNIRITYRGGGTLEQAGLEPPEKESAYPDPNMFGVTPSYGFYLRHVKGIAMDGVRVETAKEDARPAFWLFDVAGADLRDVTGSRAAGAGIFALREVTDFWFHASPGLDDIRLDKVVEKTVLPAALPGLSR